MTVAFAGLAISLVLFRVLVGVGFIVVTFLMGVLLQKYEITLLDRKENSIANVFVLGFLFVLSLSQILIVPPTLYGIDVTTATPIWWGIFIILSIITIIKCKHDLLEILRSIPVKLQDFFVRKKCGGVYGVLSVGLVALQLVGSLVLYHYDDDDAIYVTTIASNIAEDNFFHYYGPTGEHTSIWSMAEYITNGWYDLLTIICQSTKLPAAVLMHTVLPPLLIALVYAVIVIFARLLINKESQRYLFIIFVSIINIFNNVSTHTSSSVLLMRMHQGKASFANLIVPIIFCIFLLMWESIENKRYLWLLFMANTCACAFSTSGLVFGAMLTFIFALIYSVFNKNIKGGMNILLTVVPNAFFAAIYVIERLYGVW